MRLIIGNKRFSSWSLRPWLALRASGLAFEEELVPFADPAFKQRVLGPTAKVPVLVDGELIVHESLAICEYVAELAPQLWPADRAARARARALSHEMHAGFAHLRETCTMDLYVAVTDHALDAGTAADVARINALITEAVRRSGGPFLFGDFSVADAMYAPVATRFRSYDLPVATPEVHAWLTAVLSMPSMVDWREAASLEVDWGEHP